MTDFPVKVTPASAPLGAIKSFLAVQENVLNVLPEMAFRQPMVSGRFAHMGWHMVMEPTALRRVMRDNLANYPKSSVTTNILRPAIGDSILLAEGADWRKQHRAAVPVFTPRNIGRLAPYMVRAAQGAVKRIGTTNTRPVNLHDEMVRATFDVISDVTFSGEQGLDRAVVHKSIEDYMAGAARMSFFDLLALPNWVPRPHRIFGSHVVKHMHHLADQAIDDRQNAEPNTIPDLMDLLIDTADPETGEKLTDLEVRNNLLTFIVAGHETTALALAWACYLVAHDTRVQDKARAEIAEVTHGAQPDEEHVADLKYVRMIIDEALRLYPPAAFVSRTAQADDVLAGRTINKGDTVMLPFYALHRNHVLWDKPDDFIPERFEDRDQIERFSYMPFGDGPRICIGMRFALQEAIIILASLLQAYEFTPVQGKDPKPVMVLTLRPEGGVWLNARALS